MDVLEQFLNSISYKFPKGYPDMSDPKDVELLHRLINEVKSQPSKTIVEGSEEDIYDGVIRKALGLKEGEPIPQPKGKYTLKDGTFM